MSSEDPSWVFLPTLPTCSSPRSLMIMSWVWSMSNHDIGDWETAIWMIWASAFNIGVPKFGRGIWWMIVDSVMMRQWLSSSFAMRMTTGCSDAAALSEDKWDGHRKSSNLLNFLTLWIDWAHSSLRQLSWAAFWSIDNFFLLSKISEKTSWWDLVFISPVQSGFLMLRGLNRNRNRSAFSQKPKKPDRTAKRPQTTVFCSL